MNQKNRSSKGIVWGVAALAVGLCAMDVVAQTTYTWETNNGNMTTASNWSPDGLPINGNIGEVGGGVSTITARFDGNLYLAPSTAPAELRVLNNGTVELRANITANHNIVLDGGTLLGQYGSISYAGTTYLKSDTSVGGMILSGLIADYDASNAGTMLKQGAGKLALTGVGNTFTGGIDVQEGELVMSANNTTGTGAVIVASSANLNFSTSVAQTSTIVLDGGRLYGYWSSGLTAPVQVRSNSEIGVGVIYGSINDHVDGTGKLTKVASPAGTILRLVGANAFSGELAIADGPVILEHVDAMSSGTNALSFVSNASSKLLNLGGHSITVSSLSGSPGTGSALIENDPYDTSYGTKSWSHATLTVDQDVDTTYGGRFAERQESLQFDLNLIKTGMGTLTLTGASSTDWTRGSKTINQGTLVVGHADALGMGGTITVANGATLAVGSGVTFSRPVTFNAGSTLGGNGTYNPGGPVTVANGMTVAPGLSPGRLTLPDTTFGDGVGAVETLLIELGGATPGTGYDQLAGLGGATLTIVSGTELAISLYGGYTIPAGGASFQILDWDAIVGSFEVVSLPVLTGLRWDTSALYTTGTIAAIPEPATLSLLALSGGLLLHRRRRAKMGS